MSIYRTAIYTNAANYNLANVEVDTDYEFGDGNHQIKVSGNNTDITTGNGTNEISLVGSHSNITTGNGRNNIKVKGSYSNVKLGDGEHVVVHYGSDSKIIGGTGNHKITSIGDNKTIYTKDGDDEITFIGDNCTLDAGNGNNNIIFWGNDVNITTGRGNDDIKTFDQIYDEKNKDDLTLAFVDTLPTNEWDNWIKMRSNLIDYSCKKSTFKQKRTWVYEDVYYVETYFSRYINGLKNVNIDMGDGKNTASLTLDKDSATVVSNGVDVINQKQIIPENNDETDTEVILKTEDEIYEITNGITFNANKQIDKLIGERYEHKIRSKSKTNTRVGKIWKIVGVAAAGLTFGLTRALIAGTSL